MPPIIAPILGAALPGVLGTGFLGSLITNVLLGAVSSLLKKKPKKPSFKDQGLTTMVRQAITSRNIVYGRIKKSGPIVYMSTTNNNKFLHLCVALASHQCEEIESIFFNETELTWNSSTGQVTAGDYAGKAEIYANLGSDSQAADANLLANVPDEITSNHRLRGICYIYAKLTWDSKVYKEIPNISVIMKGKNDILDTRTSTTGYTTNAVLCILDYLRNTNLGLGISATEYDTTNIDTEANICDELVPLSGGGSEARYMCNGSVDTSIDLQTNIDELLSCIAGKLTYRNGKFFILTGVYRTPTVTLTEDDIISNITVNTKLSRQELFNGVRGVHISPDNEWQPADFPAVKSSTYKTEDNNERIWRDLELPYTQSTAAAQRISKILLFAARQQITVSFTANMKAFQVAVGDVILLDDDNMGWDDKPFEVVEWQFVPGEGDKGLGVHLALRETASSVFEWDTDEESTIDPAPNTNLDSINIVETPTGLTLNSDTDQLLQDGATIISRIKVSWDAPTGAFVLDGGRAEIEFKKSTDTPWSTSLSVVRGDSTESFISPVEDGIDYDVRLRFRNSTGAVGDWLTVTDHTVIGKTAEPATVTGFAVAQNGAFVTFTWSEVSDIDLAGYEIRYGPSSDTSWPNAKRLGARIKGNVFTTGNVPPGTHKFFIRAIDTTDNYSVKSATYTATITDTGLTIDTQITKAANGWVGTLNNFVIHGSTNSLVPDSLTEGDDADDIFDNTNVEFYRRCTYTWQTIDLGSDKAVRVWADIATKILPETTGVAAPELQLAYTSDAEGSNFSVLEETNVIQSTGTFGNMVLHHTNKLVPESQDLASVDGIMDEYLQNPYTESTYISPEFDLGADLKINIDVETVQSLGPGETAGTPNVEVQLDYKLAAGAYDGFETWYGGIINARYFKIKLITTPAEGKTVITSATLNADTFAPFTGVADVTARYITLRLVVDTDVGKVNVTDYTITADA